MRSRPFSIIILIIAGILITNCTRNNDITPAFYHWQTALHLSPSEKNYLSALAVEQLYVKFFDVDWDETAVQPVPLAVLEKKDWANKALIPTIFITNRTFQRLPTDQLEWLSTRVREKIDELSSGLTIKEIQFDCDWTAATREKYFSFLKVFKEKIEKRGIDLSATIRLHQIRDFQETGVPPVDRGMLMFYNTGDVESWQEENSILNLKAANDYLSATQRYPLPLDLALPIFSWGVLFRDAKMIGLLNNLRAEALSDTTRFLKMAPNRFRVKKSTYLNASYLYEGDWIRTESVDSALLLEAALLLQKKLKFSKCSIAFYHLDTATIKHFPYEKLEKIYQSFENK